MANRCKKQNLIFYLICAFICVVICTGCNHKQDYNTILLTDWDAIENSYYKKDYDLFLSDYNNFKKNFNEFKSTLEYSIYDFLGSDVKASNEDMMYASFLMNINDALSLIDGQLSDSDFIFESEAVYSAMYDLRKSIIYFQVTNLNNANITNNLYLNTLIIIGILIVALASFLFVTMKKYEKELDDSEQLNTYSTIMIDGIEKERKRFSKEIHDTVLQDIRAIQLEAELKDVNQEKILELSKNAIVKLRKICTNHTPPELAKLSSKNGYFLIPTIVNYCNDFFSETNINVTTKIQDDIEIGFFSVQKNLNIFRIIQEALNNVAHHSQAKNVSLLMRNKTSEDKKNYLIFIINDDGIGFNTDFINQTEKFKKKDGNHFGLFNMFERSKIINAELQFFSEPGEGTQVILEIPLE